MTSSSLRADCSRCAALCCVALAFDRSRWFAFDKAAGIPCPLLDRDCRCRVHRGLAARGLSGCARYECFGAGQRVVQEIFAGRSWRDHPELLDPMLDAFRVMREVQDLLLLLETAGRLPLSARDAARRVELTVALDRPGGWSRAALARFDLRRRAAEVRAFLSSLAAHSPVLGRAPLRLHVHSPPA